MKTESDRNDIMSFVHLMKKQFVIMVLAIFTWVPVMGIFTSSWLPVATIGGMLVVTLVVGAPFVYTSGRKRLSMLTGSSLS